VDDPAREANVGAPAAPGQALRSVPRGADDEDPDAADARAATTGSAGTDAPTKAPVTPAATASATQGDERDDLAVVEDRLDEADVIGVVAGPVRLADDVALADVLQAGLFEVTRGVHRFDRRAAR